MRSARYVFGRGRRSTRVEIEDADSSGARLVCFWFFAAKGIVDAAKPGTDVVVVGRLSVPARGGGAMMAHPDLIPSSSSDVVRARYPYVGVGPGTHRALVERALEVAFGLDPVPEGVARGESFDASFPLADLHRPPAGPDRAALHRAHERLAWAEAFSHAWIRAGSERAPGSMNAVALPESPPVVERVEAELGFSLTAGQRRAAREIAADLAREAPMRRLLLGEVGSGKTAVVLLAIAQTVAAGARALVLAPTTVLADQYRGALEPLVRAIGARLAVVTSAATAAERRSVEERAARGDLDVVVGTHWLVDDRFALPALGLVVIDEQQRLGVLQRLALSAKGERHRPHLLTVSATPIPRTLALALRGEIATSELDELPPGRCPVATELVPRPKFEERVVPAIERAVAAGDAVLCVCPRIGDDEDESTGPSVGDTFRALRRAFGDRVVVGHGGMPAKELSKNVERLRRGDAAIFVGTTIVEVGLDIPRATLMVIDGAEYFGLAQLHQLRGRVGRSERAASCLLVHDEPLAPPARQRFDALVRLRSGRDVARRDLELRGAGDLGGVRQSGDRGLSELEMFQDSDWLRRIPDHVARLRIDDPDLSRPEHAALRLFVERFPARTAVREEAG